MITAGYIWAEIEAAIRLQSAAELIEIKRSTNLAYADICRQRSWAALRRKTTLALVNGLAWLPGDLAGIDAVWDASGELRPGSGARIGDDCDAGRQWFLAEPATDHLAVLTVVDIDSGATTFTCAGWLPAFIGEYIQFGQEPGVYKLSAANTIATTYYGPQTDDDYALVRPAGTQQIGVVDEYGNALAGNVTLYYWVQPAPLYQEWQPVLLPSARMLELAVLIRMLGTKDRNEGAADRYRQEYDQELAKAEGMNPKHIGPKPTLNIRGFSMFDMHHR